MADQFAGAPSPPIFLLLTILLAHMIELRLTTAQARAAVGMLGTEQNLPVFRALFSSPFPLALAVRRVRGKNEPLTRATLKPAFYSQCCLAGPFVLSLDVALVLVQRADDASRWIGTAVLVAGFAWFLAAVTEWFARNERMSRARAALTAMLFVGIGAALLFATLAAAALALL